MDEPKLKLIGEGVWNGDMLKMGIALRGLTAAKLATDLELKRRDVYAFIGGKEPDADSLNKIAEALYFPSTFFYRAGEFPERDERYPLDMYVPKRRRSLPTRESLTELLQLIPDDDLPELHAYMHELARYSGKVTRLE